MSVTDGTAQQQKCLMGVTDGSDVGITVTGMP